MELLNGSKQKCDIIGHSSWELVTALLTIDYGGIRAKVVKGYFNNLFEK